LLLLLLSLLSLLLYLYIYYYIIFINRPIWCLPNLIFPDLDPFADVSDPASTRPAPMSLANFTPSPVVCGPRVVGKSAKSGPHQLMTRAAPLQMPWRCLASIGCATHHCDLTVARYDRCFEHKTHISQSIPGVAPVVDTPWNWESLRAILECHERFHEWMQCTCWSATWFWITSCGCTSL
jgi:hypothetical protein